MPSTLHGTQAPHPPVPSASVAISTPGDAAAAGDSAAVAPGKASAAAVPSVANAAAATSATVATAIPAAAPLPALNPPAPPVATAVAHSGGATGTTQSPLRSQRNPQRGDLLLYLPGRPVVVDVCVTHRLASSSVGVAAWGAGVSAEAKDALKPGKYSRTGTVACRFVPLSPLPLPKAWPCALGCPSDLPDNWALRVPAKAGGICVVVWLNPPELRSGLRWLRGSGDDPVGCG